MGIRVTSIWKIANAGSRPAPSTHWEGSLIGKTVRTLLSEIPRRKVRTMRFNGANQSQSKKIQTYEGGDAYEKSPLEDWMNFLFSSYLENKFYESDDEQLERFMGLTDTLCFSLGPDFLAKASIYARRVLGMREAPMLVAAYLNKESFDYKRNYYRGLFRRPDDVAEVFAILESYFNRKPSHALVRGAGDYLSGLSQFTLGKYKMKGRQYNIYDLVNLCHAHSEAICKLKNDTLIAPETWENMISNAADDMDKAKRWIALVDNHRLGYLALIRNLRNILWAANLALPDSAALNWLSLTLGPQITNETSVRQSLVFPYQIYTAYKYVREMAPIVIRQALEAAFKISVENTPYLPGVTAVMLDISGSMSATMSHRSVITLKEIGACYAASLFIHNPSITFIKFGTYARQMEFFRFTEPFTLIEQMCAEDNLGCSTQVDRAFAELKEPVDRIFLISDQQNMAPLSHTHWSWLYGCEPEKNIESYTEYCQKYGAAHLFSFDLANYKGQYENPHNSYIHLLTSLNDSVQKFIPLMEEGEADIKNEIERYVDLKYL